MLTDQIFMPLPVIIVGPEMFWSAASSYHSIDLGIVRRFRAMQQVPLFRFWYLFYSPTKIRDAQDFPHYLSKSGIYIEHYWKVEPRDFVSPCRLQVLRDVFKLADAAFSPELTANCLPWHQPSSSNGLAFLCALEDFSQSSAIPYSEEELHKRITQWTLKLK